MEFIALLYKDVKLHPIDHSTVYPSELEAVTTLAPKMYLVHIGEKKQTKDASLLVREINTLFKEYQEEKNKWIF